MPACSVESDDASHDKEWWYKTFSKLIFVWTHKVMLHFHGSFYSSNVCLLQSNHVTDRMIMMSDTQNFQWICFCLTLESNTLFPWSLSYFEYLHVTVEPCNWSHDKGGQYTTFSGLFSSTHRFYSPLHSLNDVFSRAIGNRELLLNLFSSNHWCY